MTETVMVVVTAAALALALAMGIILAKILRHERRRSDARAAMLAEMAVDSDESYALDEFAADLEIGHAPSGELFAPPRERSAWPHRLAIVGVLALVLIGVAGLARVWSTSSPQTEDNASIAAADQAAEAPLLDLLSLRHTQQAGALTITGLVQNPRGGATLSKVTATAMLFGGDDAFIGSGRTPLDLTSLRSGDESGFVISVPVSTTVTRYRIGFRGEDGRIIGHVDRRSPSAIARGPS